VINLVRPRTPEQIALLAFTVLPSFGANLRVLKITGIHDVSVLPNNNEAMTLSPAVLQQIKDSCTGLRTFVMRKCKFDLAPGFQDLLPGTLETLEFNGCRWSNLYNFYSSFNIKSIKSNYYTSSPFQMHFISFAVFF
jgi:hypothetical protein